VALPDTSGWDRTALRRAAGIRSEEPVAFGAGRIFSQKGFEYFVEALAMLHKQGVRIHGAIAGGGEEDTVRALAVRYGIVPYIHLLGHRDDVLDLMYGADVFVLSSIDEGLPNVVLEAMSVGTPVVAADAGGTSEIITEGYDGFVVPIRDSSLLAARIGQLVGDGVLRKRIGATGRETVAMKFSIPAMVRRIESLFYSSIQETGKGKRS
jgi:glycosyltransferase involved in cell wall biosynthesis